MKNFINTVWICLLTVLFTGTGVAQSAHSFLRKGDQSYKDSDYTAAEENYRKSLQEKSSDKGSYNLGNSIYNQERFDEAIKHYNDVVSSTKDNTVKSRAYHNLGNAHFGKQEFDKSIDAYKNALRLNPSDIDTKKNLAMAQKQLMQQQQQQQQQSDEKNDEDQENKEQEQQQQQEQKEQEQQEQEQQPGEEQEQEQEQDQPQEKDLSKEEARKLLQIMEEEERKVQEKMRKADSKKSKSDKDW